MGETVGNYRIVELLGEGGMGAVYLGERPEIESRVAIKVLHQKFVEDADMVRRFFDEARAVNRVRHPGLVQIHDYDRQDGVGVYLVMEYLRGRTLRDEIRELGPLPHDRAVRLLLQVASALAAVHEKGIIHRDLKPANIQLVTDPAVAGGERVKLLDFGIAKLRGDGEPGTTTRSGLSFGTPLYMAPEQCKNTKGVDHRADIYAVGAITYEMLCGRPPYLADSMYELAKQHLTCPLVHPCELTSSVPRKLGDVVLKALATDPDRRYQTTEALAGAAQSATRAPELNGDPGEVGFTGTVPRRSSDAGREGWSSKQGEGGEDRETWDMATLGLEADEASAASADPGGQRDAVARERLETTSLMMAGETEAPRTHSSRKSLGLAAGAGLLALVAVLVVLASRDGREPAPVMGGASIKVTEPSVTPPTATVKTPASPATALKAPPSEDKTPTSGEEIKGVAVKPPDAVVVPSEPTAPRSVARVRRKRRHPHRPKRPGKRVSPGPAMTKKMPAPAPKKDPGKKPEEDLRFTDLED